MEAIKIVDKTPKKRFQGLSLAQRFALAEAISKGLPMNPHLDKLQREIAILKKCSHPNVVQLREVIDDPKVQKIYIVLEYLKGGEIQWQHEDGEKLGPTLSLSESRRIFRDLVNGVVYCKFFFQKVFLMFFSFYLVHEQGIIHR